MKFNVLNKLLQRKLYIRDQIHALIFDNFAAEKFIDDPITKTKKLNPKNLEGIREFNQLKRLIANCANKNKMVDIELLKSLVDQGTIRREMMAIEMRVSDLDIGKSLE